MCISVSTHVPISGSVFGLAAVQKEIYKQIQRIGVQSPLLALGPLEFLFGLLIKRSISDKTSNCLNVVSVSVLALEV